MTLRSLSQEMFICMAGCPIAFQEHGMLYIGRQGFHIWSNHLPLIFNLPKIKEQMPWPKNPEEHCYKEKTTFPRGRLVMNWGSF